MIPSGCEPPPRPSRLPRSRSQAARRAGAAPVVDARRPAVWHRPALAAPERSLCRALAGGGLAEEADTAAGTAGRALRAPPPPAALGVAAALGPASAVARARPVFARRDHGGHWLRTSLAPGSCSMPTAPPATTARACSGTSPASAICCSSRSTRARPCSPPAPATASAFGPSLFHWQHPRRRIRRAADGTGGPAGATREPHPAAIGRCLGRSAPRSC